MTPMLAGEYPLSESATRFPSRLASISVPPNGAFAMPVPSRFMDTGPLPITQSLPPAIMGVVGCVSRPAETRAVSVIVVVSIKLICPLAPRAA